MKNTSFFKAMALLVGTVVGAGFLGIPYVVSRVGFPVGVSLIIGIGLVMTFQLLALAEVSLRTESKHQLAGYVTKYLGSGWKPIIYTLIIAETYGALLAYVIGEGQVLAALFGGKPLLFSVGFLLLGAVGVLFDIKFISRADLVLTSFMIAAVLALAALGWPQVKAENLLRFGEGGLLSAYGVILFAFLGGTAIPEMRMALAHRESLLPRAVGIAMIVPILVYLIFTAVVLGVSGADTSQVATVALGQKLGSAALIIGNLLAAVTMTTAFFGLALALKETYIFDLKTTKTEAWLLTILVPFIFFIFGVHNFISTLLVVGAVFGGLIGIILVLTWWKAAISGDRKPEFVLRAKPLVGTVLILVFAFGLIYTILDFLR